MDAEWFFVFFFGIVSKKFALLGNGIWPVRPRDVVPAKGLEVGGGPCVFRMHVDVRPRVAVTLPNRADTIR